MKLQSLSLALMTTLGFAGVTYAAIESGQSYSGPGLVIVDQTSAGASGAGVDGLVTPYNQPQAFSHFTAFGADANNVYSFISSAAFSSPWIPAVHKELGYWAFQGLGHSDAWFGEWAPENRTNGKPNGTIDYSKRVVYFIGDKNGLTLPSSGTVNYSVKGINQYNANSTLLTGTLIADFGSAKDITGSISRTIGSNTDTLTFNNVKFNGSTGLIDSASLGGNVSAIYNSLGVSGTGAVSGQFSGNQAVAGAGGLTAIAKFGNRNLDTAIGGKN